MLVLCRLNERTIRPLLSFRRKPESSGATDEIPCQARNDKLTSYYPDVTLAS